VHADGEDNFLCVFAGTKRLALWHPSLAPTIMSSDAGWREATEEDAAYGGFAGPPLLDVAAVNLSKLPAWRNLPRYEATLRAGDCLFLPRGWIHHVYSFPERNLAVNMWWDRPSCREATLQQQPSVPSTIDRVTAHALEAGSSFAGMATGERHDSGESTVLPAPSSSLASLASNPPASATRPDFRFTVADCVWQKDSHREADLRQAVLPEGTPAGCVQGRGAAVAASQARTARISVADSYGHPVQAMLPLVATATAIALLAPCVIHKCKGRRPGQHARSPQIQTAADHIAMADEPPPSELRGLRSAPPRPIRGREVSVDRSASEASSGHIEPIGRPFRAFLAYVLRFAVAVSVGLAIGFYLGGGLRVQQAAGAGRLPHEHGQIGTESLSRAYYGTGIGRSHLGAYEPRAWLARYCGTGHGAPVEQLRRQPRPNMDTTFAKSVEAAPVDPMALVQGSTHWYVAKLWSQLERALVKDHFALLRGVNRQAIDESALLPLCAISGVRPSTQGEYTSASHDGTGPMAFKQDDSSDACAAAGARVGPTTVGEVLDGTDWCSRAFWRQIDGAWRRRDGTACSPVHGHVADAAFGHREMDSTGRKSAARGEEDNEEATTDPAHSDEPSSANHALDDERRIEGFRALSTMDAVIGLLQADADSTRATSSMGVTRSPQASTTLSCFGCAIWEVLVGAHWSLLASSGILGLDEVMAFVKYAGDAYPPLRRHILVIGRQWADVLPPKERKAANEHLAWLQIAEPWDYATDGAYSSLKLSPGEAVIWTSIAPMQFVRPIQPPHRPTLASVAIAHVCRWFHTAFQRFGSSQTANVEYAPGSARRSARLRTSHDPSRVLKDGEPVSAMQTRNVFGSRIAIGHVDDSALLRELSRLASALHARAARGRSSPLHNNDFFRAQMRNQDAISRQRPIRTLIRLARKACDSLIRATSPHLMRTAKAEVSRLRVDVWAALLDGDEMHDTHVHEGSICSGVLYVDIPPAASPLVFYDPRGADTHFPDLPARTQRALSSPRQLPESTTLSDSDERTDALRKDSAEVFLAWQGTLPPFTERAAFLPTPGRMIVFPSFLAHAVLASASNEGKGARAKRVSYAFNVNAGTHLTAWRLLR